MKLYKTIIVFLCFLLIPSIISAESYEEIDESIRNELSDKTYSLLEDTDLTDMEELFNNSMLSERISFTEFLKKYINNGWSDLSFSELMDVLKNAFIKSFSSCLIYILEIIILILLTGFIKNINSDSLNNKAGKAANMATYILTSALAASLLTGSIHTAKNALDNLGEAINIIAPILVTLLTGIGSLSSASIMNPLTGVLTSTVFGFVKKFVFPAVIISAVFTLLSNISSTIKFSKICELISSVIKWIMGITFTVFLGISALKGLAGASIDGIYFKTAKYTIDKTIPYMGGMFSDTLDTVMSCGIIAKNAVGTAGIMIISVIIIYPLVALITNIFVFKIGAAVAEPFSDSSLVTLLTELSKTVTMEFVILLACSIMAFILMCLFIGAADISFMMR